MADLEKHIIKDSSIAQKALNNPKCSDIVFVVNNTKYYAYRNFVANASTFFQTLLEGEFKESSQKEITLNDTMTYEDNFLVILTSIYGLEVNLQDLSNLQACELLHLTEYFALSNLGTLVQNYLTNLEFCDLDFESVATLINLAALKSYNELYQNAQKFIFANAKDFIVHPSFVELHHDVLTDLLKSDSFYADEFIILIGLLNWCDENSYEDDAMTKSESTDLVEANSKDTSSEDEGFIKMSSTSPALSGETKTDQKVLKELLKLVRSLNVNLFVFFKTLKDKDLSNIFSKYQTALGDVLGVLGKTPNAVERKYQPLIFDFTVKDIDRKDDGSVKSGVYLAKNMKWKLKVKWSKQANGLNVFLRCASSEKNWECAAMCDIRLLLTTGKVSTAFFQRYEDYSFTTDNYEICKVPLIALSDLKVTHRQSFLYEDGSCKIRVTIHPADPIFM